MRELSAVAMTWLSAFVNSVHVSQHIISAGFSPTQCKYSFCRMWRSTLLHSYRHVFRCNDFMIPESRVLMQTTLSHPSHLASLLLSLHSTGRFDAACVINASKALLWSQSVVLDCEHKHFIKYRYLCSGLPPQLRRLPLWSQKTFRFLVCRYMCLHIQRGRWLECAKQDCQQIFVCMPLH